MSTRTAPLALHTADILDRDGVYVVTLTGFVQQCNDDCHPGNCEAAHAERFGSI